MRRKNRKKWAALLLAAVMTAGLIRPHDANAAGGSYTGSGTFHIDQFGEYDINAEVTVTDGVISDLEITGDNFSGTYAEVNKAKLSSAIKGMTDRIKGLSDTDSAGLNELDGVSGATYSSNGIKEAVADALALSLDEGEVSNVPAKVPDAGIYDVTVAVRSDVVDHSLVQTETAPAVLTVDEDGGMTLSYTMVSGTDQEPMYILGFNGYYAGNDRFAELSMEGASYDTAERNSYTVVTDVSFPLSGLSQYYYNNTRIYVPAMSGLNGEIAGIYFENGEFSVDAVVTVYWDTLARREETDIPEEPGISESWKESTDVTATVNQEASSPSYEVTVPAALDLGTLKTAEDNIQEYEVTVSCEEKEGVLVVEAPEGGSLYSGKNALSFTNDFGTKTCQIQPLLSSGANETVFSGRIVIAGEDVASAEPGNYTGTTIFTISYNSSGTETTDPGGEDTDKEDFLKEGRYTVNVALWHATEERYSMGNAALDPQGVITADKDGNLSLQLTFRQLDISGIKGYLYGLKKVDMSTVEYNAYHYPLSYEAQDGEVIEYYEDVYDDFNNPDSPFYDENTEGKEYPKVISIPVEQNEDMNFVEIYVPVMESIGTGQGTQVARLQIDWSTLAEYTGSEDSDDTQDPSDGRLDIYNLPDGVYSITGNMVKTDRETLSMSDNAINHTVKLTVKDGKYYITMNFNGLQYAGQYGYLSSLKYFLAGYTTNQYGVPQGDLADVTIDSYQTDEDGSRITDSFGTDYPDYVTFELIPEALDDGFVPLQVFVPIMESIAEGTGTQEVYLKLDWSTIETAEEDDLDFEDDGNNNGNGDDGNGGSGLTGGSSLTGGSGLGSFSLGNSSLGGSGLGLSSLGSGGLTSTSGVKTDDTSADIRALAGLLGIGCMAAAAGLIQRRKQKKDSEMN